ncbi:hypothetical protein [Flavobacterium psychrotrophum]|uniref:hypothetical protein n=1 Tax=Flavobacterium psychrotrophum TaxID=2294119 RepID=UPI000E3109AB|nr:hypothetical protein [Flavobacterium psychrotrophum]
MERPTSGKTALETHLYQLQREATIAEKLGLPKLDSGVLTLRDARGFRENEKFMEYFWVIDISVSFTGWFTIFGLKFKQHAFRKYTNAEELITGLYYSMGSNEGFHTETLVGDKIKDTISEHHNFNLTDPGNQHTAIAEVSYNLHICNPHLNTFISTRNPQSEDWKNWEDIVWKLASKLSADAGDNFFKETFSENYITPNPPTPSR